MTTFPKNLSVLSSARRLWANLGKVERGDGNSYRSSLVWPLLCGQTSRQISIRKHFRGFHQIWPEPTPTNMSQFVPFFFFFIIFNLFIFFFTSKRLKSDQKVWTPAWLYQQLKHSHSTLVHDRLQGRKTWRHSRNIEQADYRQRKFISPSELNAQECHVAAVYLRLAGM